MTVFEQLVAHFIHTDEIGHYDTRNWSIMLYEIRNKPDVIRDIKSRIEKITTKYRLIVLDEGEPRTNINILDIDL